MNFEKTFSKPNTPFTDLLYSICSIVPTSLNFFLSFQESESANKKFDPLIHALKYITRPSKSFLLTWKNKFIVLHVYGVLHVLLIVPVLG